MIIGIILDDTLDRPDGVQQSILTIREELVVRGHEVHFIVPKTTRDDIPYIHSLGKFVSVKFNGNSVRTPLPVSKKSIDELFSEVDFDVLHLQMPFSPFYGQKIIKLAPKNIKIIGTFHILPFGMLSRFSMSVLGVFLKPSRNLFHKIFAVSKPALEFMNKTMKIEGEVLHNPVNFSFYNKFIKNPKTKKQIVYVGRFDDRKGVKELVEAYSGISYELQSTTELIMCGRGPLLDSMQKLAKDLNVDIKFPGFVSESEKAQYLANADIAVFPSKSGESFGIVLTEAMSSGSGVTLGGNNPGYSSVLGQWSETIFDPKNIDGFSKILEKFLTNDKLRKKIGSQQHVEVKIYDVKEIVDKLIKVYEI